MAEKADEGEKKEGGSVVGFIIVVVVLALIGAGAGAGFSFTMLKPGPPAAVAEHGQAAQEGAAKGEEKKLAQDAGGEAYVTLDPILVTIANPREALLRLDAVVVFPKAAEKESAGLAKRMVDDITTYMSTLALKHIDTPSGLEFLKEDLHEIVQLRSKGKARGIIIKAFMVE